MNHIDLFSGIGGFSLAADWVWGEDHHIHSFVEIDKFCQKVLKKHWPKVPIHDDIRSYKHDGTTIDLLTAGFPCQPASVAGKRKGTGDDRWLWPETFRVIREFSPTWVILENVSGLLTLEKGMVFESLLVNLESEGYEVQPIIIPACAVNAPHRRDRVWIIAFNSSSDRWNGGANNFRIGSIQDATIGKIETDEHKRDRGKLWFRKRDCHVADSQSRKAQPSEQERFHAELSGQNSDVTDTGNEGLQGSEWPGPYEQGKTSYGSITKCNSAWDEPWLETATRLCRVDDGLPRRMDRTKRLKALGNAIVPQVVVPIMQAIKDAENNFS